MSVLPRLFGPDWRVPFAAGCATGLTSGALLLIGAWWSPPWFRSSLIALGASPTSAIASQGKQRKPRRFARRGTGAQDAKNDDADGADPKGCARTVLCEDAVKWMSNLPGGHFPEGSCVITGIPDVREVDSDGQLGLDGWRHWFMGAVELILKSLPDDSFAILMQTDIKVDRECAQRGRHDIGKSGYWEWVDKAHLVLLAAAKVPSVRLLWHKIVFASSVELASPKQGGGRNSGVAGYTHFLCFTNSQSPEDCCGSVAFPDVFRRGLATWSCGSGAEAVERVCQFALARGCKLVVDPFCGEGSVLAIANVLGVPSLGVELCKKRARTASKLDGRQLLAADREERMLSA